MTTAFRLEDHTAYLARGPIEERVRWIQADHWVNTPTTRAIFQWMEYMLRSARTIRPICMQVIAGSGLGKSFLGRTFESLHPVQRSAHPLRSFRPVLFIEATLSDMGLPGLYKAILKAAWPDARALEGVCSREQCDQTLKSQQVREIIVDESADLLGSGPSTQKKVLAEFKRFGNDLQINICCLSVDGLQHAISLDKQLDSRFQRKFFINPWAESQEFRDFLCGLEMYLPFPERSNLDRLEIVRWLLKHFKGCTGSTVGTIRLAALHALDRDGGHLTLEDLELARISELPPRCALRVPLEYESRACS